MGTSHRKENVQEDIPSKNKKLSVHNANTDEQKLIDRQCLKKIVQEDTKSIKTQYSESQTHNYFFIIRVTI